MRVETGKNDGLIADQSRGAVDGMRITTLSLEIRFAAGHEEAAGFVKAVQPLEVEIAAIHDVERAGLGQQLIEDVDLVHLAVADVEEGRDVAAQIEQRVQLDRRLGRAKRRPRKHRQAQIDGGRVQGIDRLLQIDTEGLVDIQRSGDGDQALREVGVDAPVAHCVRVGQRVARDCRPNPQVIELGALRAQTGFDDVSIF